MTEIRFYHMQQKKLEQALPEIVGKALERQMRIVVKAASAEGIALLDTALWTQDPAGFLPHGHAHDGFEKDQPVWLTLEDDNPNDATVLILAEGATSAAMKDYALCCELFDGNDEKAVAEARDRWKRYKEEGFEMSYFQQDDEGRWQKKQ
jgi:DNA polymerase-3 subunit chi